MPFSSSYRSATHTIYVATTLHFPLRIATAYCVILGRQTPSISPLLLLLKLSFPPPSQEGSIRGPSRRRTYYAVEACSVCVYGCWGVEPPQPLQPPPPSSPGAAEFSRYCTPRGRSRRRRRRLRRGQLPLRRPAPEKDFCVVSLQVHCHRD